MHVVIDAMNVLGSRPDGWWRDRDGALRRLADEVVAWAATTDAQVWLVADGRPIQGLDSGRHGTVEVRYARRGGPDAADDRIVELLATLDVGSRSPIPRAEGGSAQNRHQRPSREREPQVKVEGSGVEAGGPGSDIGVQPPDPGRVADVEVVTADADLRARVRALGATVTGPRTFLARLAPREGPAS